MTKLLIFLLFVLLLPCTTLAYVNYPAQEYLQDTSTDMLNVGDKVPDVKLARVLNYRGHTARLSDFRGKLVILDFWNVGCSPCIATMPKMQALQQKYKDRLQVILVTPDSEQKVQKLFNRVKLIKNVHLPVSVSDTVLGPMFPFRLVPTHVWISEQGEVLQITSGLYAVEEKVTEYFAGKQVNLPVTNQHKDFDFKTPLWIEGGGRQRKYLQYYSYIMQFTPDAGGLTGITKDPATGEYVRVVATNQTILQLCKMAYGRNPDYFANPFKQDKRIILKVKDTSPFIYPGRYSPEKDQWRRKNLFCYELVVPPGKSGQLFDFMQQDLARFFNITGNIEKRRVNCLVLKRTTTEDRLATRGGPLFIAMNYGESLTIRNQPVNILLNTLHTYFDHLPTPIINATGYTGNIDIKINAKLSDLEAVKKELKRYGLALTEEEREIDMLVLTEKD